MRKRKTRFLVHEQKQMNSKYEWLKDFENLIKEYYRCDFLTREQYFTLSVNVRTLRSNLASVIAINSDNEYYE